MGESNIFNSRYIGILDNFIENVRINPSSNFFLQEHMTVLNKIKKIPIVLSNYWKALTASLCDLIHYFVIYFPGQTGKKLRQSYYRRKMKHLGKDVRIDPGVHFQHPELITIGDNCWIEFGTVLLADKPSPTPPFRLLRGKNQEFEGEIIIGNHAHIAPYSVISGMGGLKIGDNVSIGSKSSIYTYTRITRKPHVLYSGGMVIEDEVVIGTNSTLIGVSLLEKGSIIKPNSVRSDIFPKKD